MKVSVFVSDRHRGIAKWIREVCKETTHYYDIWHVARSVTKKLLAASKEKGCEIIKEWSKGIRRHLYWSATSTKPGFSNLTLAKWKSFLRYVANKHSNHPDPLYHKCNHEELPPRKWIKIGELSHFTVFNASHVGSSVLLFVLFVCLFFFQCNKEERNVIDE